MEWSAQGISEGVGVCIHLDGWGCVCAYIWMCGGVGVCIHLDVWVWGGCVHTCGWVCTYMWVGVDGGECHCMHVCHSTHMHGQFHKVPPSLTGRYISGCSKAICITFLSGGLRCCSEENM